MPRKEAAIGAHLSKVVRFCVDVVYTCVRALVPTSKRLYVFSQSNGRYSGNSRALFEWMVSNGHRCYWLYEENFRCAAFDKFSTHFVKKKSARAFNLCLRAEFAVISYSAGDFGWLWPLVKRTKVVMLWHAIGIKNAGLTDKKFNSALSKRFLRQTRHYSAVLSSSDVDRYNTASYQGVDVRKVFITGLPRADVYLQKRQEYISGEESSSRFAILYAPTFRDHVLDEPLFFPFQDFSHEVLQTFFQQHEGLEIHLRPHPSDNRSVSQAAELHDRFPDHIKLATSDVIDDIDEFTYRFDSIVTDYSSIYMEPLLGDVPPIFVDFDLSRYLETRGMAYDYELVAPGPKVRSFSAFCEAIEEAKRGAPAWADRREFVRKMFFQYRDAHSCQRVVNMMEALSEQGAS